MEASTAERRDEETGAGNKGRIEEIQGVVIEAVFPESCPRSTTRSRSSAPTTAARSSARSSSTSATTACARSRWT